MSATPGLVTDTISFSNVDGPGNRFVVFLQGCNFDCVACHNPQTIKHCNNCGDCIVTCPSGALEFRMTGEVEWNREACARRRDTASQRVPYDATPKASVGRSWDLVAEIRHAAPFLSGITVSGGEATQQADFVRCTVHRREGRPGTHQLDMLRRLERCRRPAGLDVPTTRDGRGDDRPEVPRPRDPPLDDGPPNDQVLASIRYLAAVDRSTRYACC